MLRDKREKEIKKNALNFFSLPYLLAPITSLAVANSVSHRQACLAVQILFF